MPSPNLKNRKYSTASISKLLPGLMTKIGGAAQAKSAASIIRIHQHWGEVIGQELASRAAPVKITGKRRKNRETGENETYLSLKIKTESALATMLAMRQAIILERLNSLFGHDKFQELKIEHGFIARKTKAKSKPAGRFDLNLQGIDDPVLKARLESLGQAVMNNEE